MKKAEAKMKKMKKAKRKKDEAKKENIPFS